MVMATLVMVVDGGAYVALGVCMLIPPTGGARNFEDWVLAIPGAFFRVPASVSGCDGIACVDDGEQSSAIRGAQSDVEGVCEHANGLARLQARLLAYVILLLGLCRLLSAMYWGCGYVFLGLISCLWEIGMLCNELLCHESVRVHKAMGMVLLNAAVSLLYIACALPYCR